MNTKIEELIKQAGILQPERFDTICGTNQLEDLIKLVAQDCMDTILKQMTYETNADFFEGFIHGKKVSWVDIRNQYGVK